jgi:hypothetical protein
MKVDWTPVRLRGHSGWHDVETMTRFERACLVLQTSA